MTPEARPLLHMLGVLRLIQVDKRNLQGLSATSLLQKWGQSVATQSISVRLAAYIQEECDAAMAFVRGTDTLTEEEKLGVLETLTKVQEAFALPGMQTALSSFLPQIDASVAQLAILTSRYNLGDGRQPEEANSLADAVEAMARDIAEAELDRRVTEVASKHLHLLATLLRNVQVMGVDAAMAAYLELLIRLRRELETAPPETKAKFQKLWPEFERWAGRIAVIEKAIEHGGTLLNKAEGAVQFLLSNLG